MYVCSQSRAREEELLQAAETGDVQKLLGLLQTGRDLNIECSDQLGRTPLLLAVVNEHKEVSSDLLTWVLVISRVLTYKI